MKKLMLYWFKIQVTKAARQILIHHYSKMEVQKILLGYWQKYLQLKKDVPTMPTRDITIYPIGGIASLQSMPEKPGQELLVALAGPAVNIVIAVALWIYMRSAGSIPDLGSLKNAEHMQNLPFSFNLFAANIALAVFNLIPAFPMDGGRVLRAILAFRMDRTKATRIAAGVGQFLAMLFVFFGFFYNFWLVFIGLFIYLGAGGEAAYETTKNVLAGLSVRDVLMTKFTVLSPDDNLEKAVRVLLDGQEQEFLITTNEQVQGVLTRKELIHGSSAFGKSSLISNSMRKDFLTLSPEMNLQDVYMKMMTDSYIVYPVQDNGKLVGMVDKENVSELILVRQAMHLDILITVDPHLHRRTSLDEIYCIHTDVPHVAPLISKWIKDNVQQPVLIGPDSESEQWVSKVAAEANAPFIALKKIHKGDRNVKVSVPDVEKYKHHIPVLVDDIISTVHTMIETIGHLKKAGMKPPVCIGIHPVLTGKAYEKLLKAGAGKVVTCNTITHPSNSIFIDELRASEIGKNIFV